MKIQTKSITLPTFAKTYRNGLKSGHGGESGALKPLEFLERKNYRFLRPDLQRGDLVFHPFTLANRDDQPDYLNIVAVPGNQYSKVENSIA